MMDEFTTLMHAEMANDPEEEEWLRAFAAIGFIAEGKALAEAVAIASTTEELVIKYLPDYNRAFPKRNIVL